MKRRMSMKQFFVQIAAVCAVAVLVSTGCSNPTETTKKADVEVNLIGIAQDGSSRVTTSVLTLTFDKDVKNLKAGDINLKDLSGTGVKKGAVTGDGKVWKLAVTDLKKSGSVDVTLKKSGYNITQIANNIVSLWYTGSTGEAGDLAGTLTITKPDNTDFMVGVELTAVYEGDEEGVSLRYRWFRKTEDEDKEDKVVGNMSKYTPTEAGDYLVTISASGYNSKSSDYVTVNEAGVKTLGAIAVKVNGGNFVGSELFADYTRVGSEVVSYQWYYGPGTSADNKIVGLSGSLSSLVPGAEGAYAVEVSAVGYASKKSASVTITDPSKAILTGTPSIRADSGAYVNFDLMAIYTGNEAITYQWNRSGTAITGATGFIFKPTQDGTYTVTVSATGKTPKSSAPVVVTKTNLSGTIRITAKNGAYINQELTAVYSGTENVKYQWFKEGNDTAVGTAQVYTPPEAGIYSVQVDSVEGYYYGKTSEGIQITLANTDGTISITPAGSTVVNETLTAHYTGSVTVAYQWNKNGTAITGATGDIVPGAADVTFKPTEEGIYTITVTLDNHNSRTSNAVSVALLNLKGIVSISPAGSVLLTTNPTLTANYTQGGDETINKWQWNKNGTAIDGATASTYKPTTEGNYTVTVGAAQHYPKTSNPVAAYNFVNVTGITNVPDMIHVDESFLFTGTVVPANATNQIIEWKIKNPGTDAKATQRGNIVKATGIGTFTIYASVKDGEGAGHDYTSGEFTITVKRGVLFKGIDNDGLTTTTSSLTLKFNKAVPGLGTIHDLIFLNGDRYDPNLVVEFDNMSGPNGVAPNITYNVPVSGFTKGGTIEIVIQKDIGEYSIINNIQSADLIYAIQFVDLKQDGSGGASSNGGTPASNTTKLFVVLDQNVPGGLNLDDFIVTSWGNTGIKNNFWGYSSSEQWYNGTLSYVYDLYIDDTGFDNVGDVSLYIKKEGYTFYSGTTVNPIKPVQVFVTGYSKILNISYTQILDPAGTISLPDPIVLHRVNGSSKQSPSVTTGEDSWDWDSEEGGYKHGYIYYYDKVVWKLDGNNLAEWDSDKNAGQLTSTITLDVKDSRYSKFGQYYLTLIVEKDGVSYNKTIPFTVGY